jgi:lysozyme
VINSAESLIEYDEGRMLWPYRDTRGHLTWGIGHNLDAAPACDAAVGLIWQAVDAQFQNDMNGVLADVVTLPGYTALDPVRAAVLYDMAFNLGFAGLSAFTTFLNYLFTGRYAAAAGDLRATRVYRQLPVRYERLAVMVETGQWPDVAG